MSKGVDLIMNVERLGNNVLSLIKKQTWFPYKSGKLKFEATKGNMINSFTYMITFDSTVAPYIDALEDGSKPHDIPRAFGRDLPFGIGGRFNGKFHPGSNKHKGFISVKSVNAICDYIKKKYKGVEQ